MMKEKDGEHPWGDTGQLVLFCLFVLVWIGDSFFLDLSNFWADEVSLWIRLAVLVISLLTALVLINSGHAVAGHHTSSKRVVKTGAFRWVRHPLYLGCLLTYFGTAFSTLSLAAIGLLLLPIFAFYNFLASYEEKLLEKEFKVEYTHYKDKTGRWIPKIGRGKS